MTVSEMKGLARIGSIAVIAFASSCADPVGCDVCRTTAIANVFVRDSADLPVAGVPVELRTYLQVCGLDLRGGEGPWVTGVDGHRRILMSSGYSPHTARCVVVTVNPESDPAQPSARAEFPANVQFRAEDGSPRDSVRLDVVVSPNGN